ncbi:MAG: EAL domain-containing protein [Bacillota bacterium]|nr:EAL domain-containing protein [Bacillota bacterium]
MNSEESILECSLMRDYLDSVLTAPLVNPIDATFQFIRRMFPSERVYIFELTDKGTAFSNTYEWCAEGIIPQKDMLQNEPIESIDWWMELFEGGNPVVISDLEEIRYQHARAYAALKPQDITSLITFPLRHEREFLGFIGVDNFQLDQTDDISRFLAKAEPYIVSFLLQSNRLHELEYRCYHDPLTGAKNQLALAEADSVRRETSSLGVVFCDISGLRMINDYIGQKAGDQAIVQCYQLLRSVFPTDSIFRLGGDEFASLCFDIDQAQFEQKVQTLRQMVLKHEQHITVGSVWTEKQPIHVRTQLSLAEASMHNEKYSSYRAPNARIVCSASPLLANPDIKLQREDLAPDSGESEFTRFMQSNYFNPEILIQSVTAADGLNYLYFGDLQSNIFYISDNMRDLFGFQSNTVANLIAVWENRISNPEDLHMYRRDIAELLKQKKDIHDLRYRVFDVSGHEIWIHCHGHVHWNEDRTEPLFFAGCIIRHEQDSMVDPITSFAKEPAAITKLAMYQADETPISIIGFAINSFTEINELRGRHVANKLLNDIARRVIEHFEGRLQFYRLDGLRFLAIRTPACRERAETLAIRLRDLIGAQFRAHNVMVRKPCAISVMNSNAGITTPEEIISTTISLLAYAKNSPDQDYVIHSPEALEEQHNHTEMVFEIAKDVQNGMENFRLVVQPTVRATDKKIIGGEALLRWKLHDKPVPPDVFIPILEKNRLISSAGRWVFEQAVRITKRTIALNPDFHMAFNVSYLQVLDPDFFPYMKQVLNTYELEASRLTLELTETNFDDSPQKLQEFFDSCQKLGIRVALDDFGNGYSSLGLLLKYPTQIVKLDRSMLNGMNSSDENRKFISSIVGACHAFGKEVCAEGVETADDYEMVHQAGCDMIQGYYFSKPLEMNDFYQLVAERDRF